MNGSVSTFLAFRARGCLEGGPPGSRDSRRELSEGHVVFCSGARAVFCLVFVF